MIGVNAVFQCPDNGVAPRYKIQVVFQSYSIIQADALVAEYTIVDYYRGKRDNSPLLSPKKKHRAIIHAVPELAKVGLAQFLKSKFRSAQRLPV